MNIAILLLCCLPPLAIMALAVIHGLRAKSAPVLSIVALSALVILTSAMLPIVGDEEPISTVRFTTPNGNDATSGVEDADTVRLARRSESQALYR